MSPLYVFILIFLWISLSSEISNVENIQNKCKRECNSNVILSNEGNLLFCDEDCRKKQCQSGCSRYMDALSSSCQNACMPPATSVQLTTSEAETRIQKQNCIQGCTFALDIYAKDVIDNFRNLPRPDLNRSSKKYSSVVLRWTGRKLENIKYYIQRRILDVPQVSKDWQIHNSSNFSDDGTIYVYNLHPYVTYKFRVLVVISPLSHHILESPETFPILTLPHGAPSSAPKITSLSAPSPSVLSITWNRPAFTNGEIIAYKITISPINHRTLKPMTKDILGDATSWTVGQLQPSQKYVVTVAASNSEGEGPADVRSIQTPNPVSANETPFLILGAANKVLKQNLIDIISVADTIMEEKNSSIKITGRETLYESESGNITGVGIHIRRQMFIISDSSETVQQVSLTADSSRENIYPSILKPTVISVDWLNDRVYIVSRNRIYGCPLDHDSCIVVVDNLARQPYDLKVDPVNGYLYFTQDGRGRGLYRIDLAAINQHKPVTPTHIVTIDDLQAFTIDFENVRLYFPSNSQNTMLSSFVDGSDIENIRPEVMRPNYKNIISLTYYGKFFYWTNGTDVFGEEFDPGFHKFRVNELLFFDNYFRGFNLYHPRMQPSPVPHAAPINLEALFGPVEVYIKWEPPPYLQYQGGGAWNNWDYELHIYETRNPEEMETYLNVTETETTVADLKPDTQYSISVRAVSEAGLGPWSEFFIGRTLKQAKIPVRVLMSTKSNIVEKDLYTDSEKTLYVFDPLTHATDIAWHNDLVMYTSNHGLVNIFDKKTEIVRHIPYEAAAECLAYDWLGEKIFWSEPKPGVIKRSSLNILATDTVYQAAARDMAIDSMSGRIYWVTTNSIESTFLNGEDLIIIYSVPYFQGKHIISLVLNFDLQKVFWYIKAFENQDLFMADLVSMEGSSFTDIRSTVEAVGDFKSISTSSSLQYYSHHLFWMDQASALVVGDLECNYTSSLSPQNSNITAFSVKHPTIQSYPDGLNATSLRVIPKPMKSSSIKVSGPSSSFNLTWKQEHEVNFGKVFYKVFIQVAAKSIHIVTAETQHLMEGLSPYTQMTVSIQPYTYWGYAEPSTVSVRSPMGVPTEPLTPRVYVTQHKNATTSQLMLAADFRWSNPHGIRGVLNHHLVYYWEKGNQDRRNSVRVDGVTRHFILNNILDNNTYFFQVKACTQVGCGPLSDTVSAVTNVVNPVPRLLIATKSSVRISEMDGHFKESKVLLPEISPTAMTFLAHDERTFWIEKSNALYVSRESANSELKQLNGSGKDLSIDWISRTLYIVEELNDESRIMGYDIDKQVYRKILNRASTVGNILSDPYTSSLFWTERDTSGHGHIYHQPFDSSEVIDLLGEHNRRRRFIRNCTCTDRLNVSPVVAMDYSNSGGTEIIFTDLRTNSIMASDGTGCRCRQVFRPSATDNKGLPPSLLAVDHLRIYWYNNTLGKLYSINKNTGLDYFEESIKDVQDIVAYGDHLQPLPDSDCLDPGRYSGTVQMVEVTNVSISLKLDTVTRPPHCGQISSPQNKYTIYYKNLSTKGIASHTDCSIERDACSKLETYDRQVKLTDLAPYTEYLIQVAVSNYYTEYLSEAMGKQVVMKTKPGVPSQVENVKASVVNPETIHIEWMPPAKPNGPLENITYIVQWSTLINKRYSLGQTSHLKQLHTIVPDLLHDQVYTVKVLSYDGSGTFYSETPPIDVKMFMLPGTFKLKKAYPNALDVLWIGPSDNSVCRVSFDYAEKRGDEVGLWASTFFLADTKDNNNHSFEILELHPNTEYTVRVQAAYNSDFPIYVWPRDNSFTFKTLTDVPDQPEPPTVSELKTGAYEIVWKEPKNNGELVSQYILEYSESVGGEWMQAYNGSMSRWVVDETLEPGKRYIFRVAAMNANGYGPFSDNSSAFLTPVAVMDSSIDSETRVVIAVVVSFIFITGVIIITAVCLYMRRRKEQKKKARQFISMHRVPDMELATLRELPHTTVQQSNTLYSINIMPTAEDIAALPHFMRDQLTLTKFLGSGAFGEVFMGVAKDILSDSSGDTRVAVKTLRKSASEHEKEEFLKEALLMSNFRHAHILGLLGVCLDNDPQFIIMELMEGGDLLSFLRSCRGTTTSPSKLLLPDLVKVCVHVARGCKYLEEMHFVHRDLAARNCLVSKKNPSDMVIKIGDFGLARDIYKNDYYRKEGEGLLPVRWMSPESLVDGVFTTPSDIWAFGVLMWEVVTLGQQPYPARTNIEVLHYVRAGGKLDRPEKTADEMFSLMQKCWSFSSEDRPSFAYLLQELEAFQEKCYDMSTEEIAQRSPTHLDAASSSLTETEEAQDPDTTMCNHPSSHSRRRGGGSIHQSPTNRRNRMTLLGGAEATDKLTVDLSTARPLKSSSSFDSKSSYTDGSHVSYSQVQRQQASDMDALGYLQPHCMDNPKYLELLNCAPEMGILQPIPVRPSPSSQSPSSSIPSSPSSLTPPGVNYAVMNGNYLVPSPPYGDSPPPPFTKESPLNPVPNGSPPPMYGNPPPTYGVVSVLRNTEKPPPYHSTKEVSLRGLEASPTNRKCRTDPSHSDRDLYSTPGFERHSSDSSSNSESGYYCVECLNNSHGSGYQSEKSAPTYSRVRDSAFNSPQHKYAYWSNNNSERNYSRNPPPGGRKEMFGCPPDYINVHGQGRTRNQVFPENGSVLAGFDIAQASLV